MNLPRRLRRLAPKLSRALPLICTGLFFPQFCALAQDSIRPSNTGSEAAAMRSQAELPAHYTFRTGPVSYDLSTALSIEANDNIGLAEDHRVADIIFRPSIKLDSAWQITPLNTLRFSLGMGYAAYLANPRLNSRSVLVDPGSQIQFDVFVGGHLKLNFHDRFAIVQNPIDEPNLSNIARFDRFQNASGVTANWDFDVLQFVLGYDHFIYRSLGQEFNFLSRNEEQFFGSASVRVSDALTVGVDANGGIVNYVTKFNNNGFTYSSGPFFEAQLSPYTKLRITGGYQGMEFDQSGTTGDKSQYNGWYANATITQRLNQYWTHALSAGHEARLGLDTNFAKYTYVRYVADWRINSRWNANLQAFLEEADESGNLALISENAFRVGATASVSCRLGERLTSTFRYEYVNKDSDLLLRSYYQNVGILSLAYDF
jgi:hypothetical protein